MSGSPEGGRRTAPTEALRLVRSALLQALVRQSTDEPLHPRSNLSCNTTFQNEGAADAWRIELNRRAKRPGPD